MKKINIAIDGLAGSGKSTVAKNLAKKLGYTYIDTGSMYRCVAYLAIKYNVDYKDEKALQEVLDKHYKYEYKNPTVILDNEDVTLKIRTIEVNQMLPNVVAIPFIRKFLIKKQQEMGKNKGVIMDGRDIGSVVLKDAELKIYQSASVETRAKRRYKENIEKGIETDYETVKKNLEFRDYTDMYVSKALVKVDDAIEIDTSNMSIDEVCDYIYELALKKVKE